jgi:peptidyl-prolyl cis-trans isomerase SurA
MINKLMVAKAEIDSVMVTDAEVMSVTASRVSIWSCSSLVAMRLLYPIYGKQVINSKEIEEVTEKAIRSAYERKDHRRTYCITVAEVRAFIIVFLRFAAIFLS